METKDSFGSTLKLEERTPIPYLCYHMQLTGLYPFSDGVGKAEAPVGVKLFIHEDLDNIQTITDLDNIQTITLCTYQNYAPLPPSRARWGFLTLQISYASHVGHHDWSNPHPVPTLEIGLDLGI